MAEVSEGDFLLASRGRAEALGAWVIGALFDAQDRLAFALADGTIHLAQAEGDWRAVSAHDAAILSATADIKDGWLSGGDDGKLVRTAPDGSISVIADYKGKW